MRRQTLKSVTGLSKLPMNFSREISTDAYLGTPEDEQAFDAFVYAGFFEHIHRLARGYSKAAAARARLDRQANPTPIEKLQLDTTAEALTQADDGKKNAKGKAVTVTDKRIISESDTHVGAGESKAKQKGIQALTLVELLYNAKLIDMNMLMAADRFRTLHLEREGPSQGVGGYGLNPGGSNPSTKADRMGSRLTGIKIEGDRWRHTSGRRGDNSYDLEAAMLAMCGVIDVEGRRIHDRELKKIMVAAITHSIDMPTQTYIARIRTKYTGEKQLPPSGATVVTEALRRLTLHLGLDGSG